MLSSGLHTVGGTLGDRALATTTAHAHAVDDKALLGLVAQTARLVRAARARGAVDDVQLAKLYESTLSKSSTSTIKTQTVLAGCHIDEDGDSPPVSYAARSGCSGVGMAYLPAANAKQEAHDIALLLLLELLEILVGAHLCVMLANAALVAVSVWRSE